MSNEAFISAWNTAIEQVISNIDSKLKEYELPIIIGKVHGAGHTLIELPLSALDEHRQLISLAGSIAVLNIERLPLGAEGLGIVSGLQLYIRLGQSNTWLYVSFESPLNDIEDLDEDFYEPQIDSETISRMALIVARSESFGGLKNKRQRQELALSLINKNSDLEIPDIYAGEVVARAESLYEFGILPERAKELSSLGKNSVEIAKSLRITRQKAERALDAVIVEHIAELLNKYPSE